MKNRLYALMTGLGLFAFVAILVLMPSKEIHALMHIAGVLFLYASAAVSMYFVGSILYVIVQCYILKNEDVDKVIKDIIFYKED